MVDIFCRFHVYCTRYFRVYGQGVTIPSKQAYYVSVAGQRYILKSEEDEQYIHTLARYVTEKIDEIQRASNAVASHSVAIMAAVNIADELFREKRTREQMRQQVALTSENLIRHLDHAIQVQAVPMEQETDGEEGEGAAVSAV